MFGGYLLMGLVYYYGVRFARQSGEFARLPLRGGALVVLAFCLFVSASAISYVRALRVYHSAHEFNQVAANIYAPRGEATEMDSQFYPDVELFRRTKKALFARSLGPYRVKSFEVVPLTTGSFVAPVLLTPGTKIVQRFKVTRPVLNSLSLPVVVPGQTASAYEVD